MALTLLLLLPMLPVFSLTGTQYDIYNDVGCADLNTSSTVSNYSGYWQYWCQGASKYYKVRQWGCRVVAQTKLLVECGAAPSNVSIFNPDIFLEWAIPLGYWPSSPDDIREMKATGTAAMYYASQKGITLTQGTVPLSGSNNADDVALVMKYINSGYYVILSGSGHQTYVGRDASLKAGYPVLLDSWNTCSYNPASCRSYKDYRLSTFSTLYYYSSNYDASYNPSGNDDKPADNKSLKNSDPVSVNTTKFTVTLNANGGYCPIETTEIEPNEIYGELPPAVLENYSFDGWYTDKINGDRISENDVYPYNEDSTLYAHWTLAREPYYCGMFSDVDDNDWYALNIASAYNSALMIGMGNGIFNVNGSVTIAEAVTIAARIHSSRFEISYNFSGGDVWYEPYVEYCVLQGIIAEDSYSDYTRNATRAEFAVIMSRSLPMCDFEKRNDIDSIPDVKISDSFGSAVYKLYGAGILTGSDEAGTFNPYKEIKRSEVAAIATRLKNAAIRIVSGY